MKCWVGTYPQGFLNAFSHTHCHACRLSAPILGSRAEALPEGGTDPDQGPLHDVAASGLQSDAEVSMSQNRRKSLAHGLLIHGLANKPSAGSLANKSSAGSLHRNSPMDM